MEARIRAPGIPNRRTFDGVCRRWTRATKRRRYRLRLHGIPSRHSLPISASCRASSVDHSAEANSTPLFFVASFCCSAVICQSESATRTSPGRNVSVTLRAPDEVGHERHGRGRVRLEQQVAGVQNVGSRHSPHPRQDLVGSKYISCFPGSSRAGGDVLGVGVRSGSAHSRA
jgi:hypothetical protein